MKNFTPLALLLSALCLSISCSHTPVNYDLSFAGITIGEEFPDSLKNNDSFEFYEHDIPFYEGDVIFNLPSTPNNKLHVVATTDLDGKKVTCISLPAMTFSEASDFFNMLKSKYGLPSSDYGDTDCSLTILLDRTYKKLGYNDYDCKIDITGDRILAMWKPASYQSVILMIANTYHFPSKFRPRLDTFIGFRYVNIDRFNAVKREAERNRVNKDRADYRLQNSKSMNQDF
ncbi:MAG: hypothetical protein NC226_09315 [Bacteroides cellulosilyticus]|nr:hypothetical protein [Bacteroides cellulosilyticus]